VLDGLHDALKSRGPGSCVVVVCNSMGLTMREALANLHAFGFYEAEALHAVMWDHPEIGDWVSRQAIQYTYDKVDHSNDIAERHRALQKRTGHHEPVDWPVASPQWKTLEARKAAGETVAPIVLIPEGTGRGLHFDGVETVFMVGLPRQPERYFHFAGRAGRLGQTQGKVVTVLPVNARKVLDSWARQIGPGVRFEEEHVERIRSANPETYQPERPSDIRRSLRQRLQRERRQGIPHGPWVGMEEEEERERLLMPGKGFQSMPSDQDGQRQLEPVDTAAARRAQMQAQRRELRKRLMSNAVGVKPMAVPQGPMGGSLDEVEGKGR